LKNNNLLKIRVNTVDNYQGEENDIIIISLVRSNKNNNLGFVKIENRICVAFSRAKMGMFVFGNFDFIYKAERENANKENASNLWQKIITLANKKNVIGDILNLCCQNHAEDIFVKKPEDFKNAPEGGCKKVCNIRLECGHIW